MMHPSSPLPTARSASGRRSARCGARPASSAVGCTRPRTCSTSCRSPSSARPRPRFRTSGWPTRKPTPRPRSNLVEIYGAKYDKAVACLTKDRSALLAFYDFPAEHWKHLRSTNPIESTFATVRHRTIRSKGCLSNKTALAMVYKLTDTEQKRRRLDGPNQLPRLIHHRRSRGHLASNSSRRLISSVTNFRR